MDDSKPSTITVDITVAIVILLLILGLFGVYIDRVLAVYRGFLEWFYSHEWRSLNFILAIIFSFINVFLLASIIILLRRIAQIKKVPPKETEEIHTVTAEEEVREAWEHIRILANSENSSDWNMAIIRADALLDDILHHKGYEGETMAERLQIVNPAILKSIDRVWSAHRLRNMIAHDPTEQHMRDTIIQALRSYEQAFKELGVMNPTHNLHNTV